MASDKILDINDDNFEETIASGVTLVDFSAEWCGPCKALSPIIEEVAAELDGVAKVGKVDIDASQTVTSKFGVTSVPTLIVFNNGEEKERAIGLKDADALKAMVSAAS